jgi:hypothetical protein
MNRRPCGSQGRPGRFLKEKNSLTQLGMECRIFQFVALSLYHQAISAPLQETEENNEKPCHIRINVWNWHVKNNQKKYQQVHRELDVVLNSVKELINKE